MLDFLEKTMAYLLLWAAAIAVGVLSLWLRRRGYRLASLASAWVPGAVSVGLLCVLRHDFNLPHQDGIAVTDVMRWFMLDDNPLRWESRAYVTAGVLVAVTLLFAIVMTWLLWRKKKA
ncbi:MAG: hypothetical protein E7541_00455 [Ruminococcaceae bacterium]|nr:hypothetical protein [Oscillospiraceae bacterium]